MGNLSEFTNLFQLSKTLRFELKPVGKTSELLKEGNLFTEKSPLKNDKQRADKVKEVKKMMDEKHKDFINKTLSAFTFPREVLENYYSSYLQVNAEEKKRKNNTTDSGTTDSNGAKDVVQDLKSVQDAMRKSISVAFKKSKDDNKKDNPEYTRLKPKNLIEKDLSNEDAAKLFNQFTTFFENYRTNRENIYSDDAKATAIAYRVVHVNLPLFIGNMKVYEQIKDKLGEDLLTKLFDDCKAYATSNEMAVHANSLDEVFTLMYFNNTLTQDQIDFYNTLIGKIVQEDHVEIKGINENINLYNQQQKNKEDRLPFFAPLKKQILSDRKTLSWQQESFKSDREVIDAIDNFYFKEEFDQTVLQATRVLLSSIAEYNLYGIFIKNDNNLSTLSQRIYKGFDITQETIQKGESESIEVDTNSTSEINNHGLIEQALKAKLRVETKRGKKKPEDYENEIEKKAKAIKSLSVQTINDIVNEYVENTGSPVALLRRVEDYFYMLRKGEFDGKDLVEYIQTKLSLYKSAKEKWQAGQNNEKFKDSEVSKAIKELLDATKQLECFLKPLLGTGEETDRDMQFYLKLQPIWETLRTFAALYDKVRNWMTRKPYSLDKIKLCFDIPDLLNGWVDSKTEKSDNGTQYGGYLFRKENEIGEYDYYLGISSQKKLFRRVSGANGEYQRLDYYQPKSTTIYGKAYQGKSYKDDKERLKEAIINYINNIEDHKKRYKIISNIPDYSKALDNDKITPSSLIAKLKEADGEAYVQLLNDETFSAINREVIDNLLITLQSLPKMALTETLLQQDFSLFTDVQIAIDKICKERIFTYFRVNNDEMEQAVNDSNNPLYLFKISNKDLSYAEQMTTGHRVHRGVENLHTILFKALMTGQQEVLDLGTGAVFFREKSIMTQETTHPAKVPIMRKNPFRQDKKSLFEYGIKKDKRYRENKMLFHLSITQNYKADDKQKFAGMNVAVQNYIRQSQDLHIIGIDRGERNLLYYSVIDMRGNIIEQNSLNIIKHADLETDYQDRVKGRRKEKEIGKTGRFPRKSRT